MAKSEPRSEAESGVAGGLVDERGGVVAFSRLLFQASGLSVDSREVVNLCLLPPKTH
jgi:hypothetical protein